MKTPTNDIAKMIDSLTEENVARNDSLKHLQEIIKSTEDTITQLTPLGTWEEIPEETFDGEAPPVLSL